MQDSKIRVILMDDKIKKEKLEQELRFLKESYEAEVISKEEFEKGKVRIERKLKENELISSKEDGNIKLKVLPDEEETMIIPPPHPSEDSQPKTGKYDFLPVGKIVWILVIGLVVFGLLFALNSLRDKPMGDASDEIEEREASNKMDGSIQNEIKQKTPLKLMIINDRKNCFNCDTSRINQILRGWFGQLSAEEFDINQEKGKSLANELEIRMLPVYIFDSSLEKNEAYPKFRKIFSKKDDYYILSDNVSASPFYLERSEIKNRLDFFTIEDDSASKKAEANLQEFLNSFKNITFEKHSSNSDLSKELGIRSFPSFLVNNRIKFNGVLASEGIKENFCAMNRLPECDKELKRSLIN